MNFSTIMHADNLLIQVFAANTSIVNVF